MSVSGTLTLPGCKSFTNRALICAALAEGNSTLHKASKSDDSQLMLSNLKAAGIQIETSADKITVKGLGQPPQFSCKQFDVGDAGTVMRFLLPYLASGVGECVIDGSPRMRERPIAPLVDCLVQLGAKIEYLGKKGYPPVGLKASGLRGGEVELSIADSSQYLSGILLAAPSFKNETQIRITGVQRSTPYLEMTTSVQKEFGVDVRDTYYVSPQPYKASQYSVPGDPSAAFVFIAAVALNGGELTLTNLAHDKVSKKLAGLDWADSLGFSYQQLSQGALIKSGLLRAAERDFGQTPDLVPMATVLSLFAKGKSKITGVPHLRFKESDRLASVAQELKKCGASIHELEQGFEIDGGTKLIPAVLSSHQDHRLVMAFSVLATKLPGTNVQDVECVSKSYPGFFKDLEGLFDKSTIQTR